MNHALSSQSASLEIARRNAVLRNTYWLLALSMVPTVAGAWVGMAAGLVSHLTSTLATIAFFGIALVGGMAFIRSIERYRHSATGLMLLLVFAFFEGVVLSPMFGLVLGKTNGPAVVMTAFAGTAGVFATMAALSSFVKRDLSGMARFMIIGLVLAIMAMVANVFLQSGALATTLSLIVIGIMSFFLLYDLKRVRDGSETNYISATLSVYLSLINIFVNVLSLFGAGDD